MSRRAASRWALAVLALSTVGTVVDAAIAAEIYTRPGRYSVNGEGWVHQSGTDSDLFECERCNAPVQVQINVSPERKGQAQSSNREFLAKLKNEDAERQFAELMVETSLPPDMEAGISIERVSKSHFGGIDSFNYVALIEVGEQVTQETAAVVLHHNRLIKVSLNHYEDSLDESSKRRVQALLESFTFL